MSDAIIVGGGPAGAALALMLGRRGLDVELYDQARFPRDKPCGEGLLPAGVDILGSLGLTEAVRGEVIRGVRYRLPGGSVHADFAASGAPASHGLGQKRLVLDAVLWNAAAHARGVRASDATRVDGPLVERQRVVGVSVEGNARRARMVVAADGSGSALRRALGLERTTPPRRVGVRAHFRRPHDAPPLSAIEIFMRPGYELYVTPLPDHEILIAALAHQDAVPGGLRAAFRQWVLGEPTLCEWLDGATQTSELMGRAPLVRRSATPPPPGLLLLGDAETSVDPVTAGGMSLALVTAELLAKELPMILAGSLSARRRFERARSRAVRVHRALGIVLLALAKNPRLAETARRFMVNCPAVMRGLVGLASRGAST